MKEGGRLQQREERGSLKDAQEYKHEKEAKSWVKERSIFLRTITEDNRWRKKVSSATRREEDWKMHKSIKHERENVNLEGRKVRPFQRPITEDTEMREGGSLQPQEERGRLGMNKNMNTIKKMWILKEGKVRSFKRTIAEDTKDEGRRKSHAARGERKTEG